MIDPLLEQLLPGFVDESQEIAERLTQNVIELEKAHEAKRFDDLARGLHTLKGSSATLGLDQLSDLAHKMEDVVLPFRGKQAPLPSALADGLLRTLDAWMANLRATAAKAELPSLSPSYELLEKLRKTLHGPRKAANDDAPAAPQDPAADVPDTVAVVAEDEEANRSAEKRASGDRKLYPAPPIAAAPDEHHADDPDAAVPVLDESGSWRVRTRDVVALLHEVERLREVRLRIEERRRELDRAVQALSRLGLSAETAEVRGQLSGVQRSLTTDGEEAGDIVASMEDGLKSITTLPVRTVLDPLRRSVRDLCRHTRKEARLSVVGGELSLDRRVLEALRGPLTHLVRNAVDHGIELPAERERRGKHTEGAVVVRVEQQGNMLFLEVADDGTGLDTPAIKVAAIERNIASAAEVDAMTEAQIHQLIFHNGFSTKKTVTELSGRGVGMDVVRSEVQGMQGHVEVQSTPGQGTRVLLTLPAELGSTPVLVVRCGEHQLGVPMSAVETSLLAHAAELRISRGGAKLSYQQDLLAVHDLGALVALRAPEPPQDGQPLLVLQSQGKRIALAVDEVIGDLEVAIRPLPPEVRQLPAYQGAAMLARGELVLIVRADWIVGGHAAQMRAPVSRRALVVDDSLTARALHRTALEAGGYLVHCASSGRQALDQLRHSSYDVIVCDIGMDEMDGFELTRAVRGEPQIGATPIVLVSAHDSSADRQRGHEVGADSFLSKKECMSGRLLAEVAAAIARRQASA